MVVLLIQLLKESRSTPFKAIFWGMIRVCKFGKWISAVIGSQRPGVPFLSGVWPVVFTARVKEETERVVWPTSLNAENQFPILRLNKLRCASKDCLWEVKEFIKLSKPNLTVVSIILNLLYGNQHTKSIFDDTILPPRVHVNRRSP